MNDDWVASIARAKGPYVFRGERAFLCDRSVSFLADGDTRPSHAGEQKDQSISSARSVLVVGVQG